MFHKETSYVFIADKISLRPDKMVLWTRFRLKAII